jgi:hypothetical protein
VPDLNNNNLLNSHKRSPQQNTSKHDNFHKPVSLLRQRRFNGLVNDSCALTVLALSPIHSLVNCYRRDDQSNVVGLVNTSGHGPGGTMFPVVSENLEASTPANH